MEIKPQYLRYVACIQNHKLVLLITVVHLEPINVFRSLKGPNEIVIHQFQPMQTYLLEDG